MQEFGTGGQAASGTQPESSGIPLEGNVARAFLTVARHRAQQTALITSTRTYSYEWMEGAAVAVRNELFRRRTSCVIRSNGSVCVGERINRTPEAER
jgi:hypothetical protein